MYMYICIYTHSCIHVYARRELTGAFAVILPAGGLVFIPVIGAVIDSLGLTRFQD